MRFSVLTLNLWNINEPLAARMSALQAGLKILRPDIVCLQEVTDEPRSQQRQSEFVAQASELRRDSADFEDGNSGRAAS